MRTLSSLLAFGFLFGAGASLGGCAAPYIVHNVSSSVLYAGQHKYIKTRSQCIRQSEKNTFAAFEHDPYFATFAKKYPEHINTHYMLFVRDEMISQTIEQKKKSINTAEDSIIYKKKKIEDYIIYRDVPLEVRRKKANECMKFQSQNIKKCTSGCKITYPASMQHCKLAPYDLFSMAFDPMKSANKDEINERIEKLKKEIEDAKKRPVQAKTEISYLQNILSNSVIQSYRDMYTKNIQSCLLQHYSQEEIDKYESMKPPPKIYKHM